MNTPPLTPDDRERLTQIDALLEHGQPSADPAANWLHRQRPPIDPAHYDQLKKEILTMTINDLTPKKKKRPMRGLPRLMKAAVVLLVLAGAYVVYMATRPVTYHTPSYRYNVPFETQATVFVAEVKALAQAIQPTVPPPPLVIQPTVPPPPLVIQPTPLPPPIVSILEAPVLPMTVIVRPSRARMFDGQPLALEVGQRVALYLRVAKNGDEAIFIELTKNAFVLSQLMPEYGYELLVENNIGAIVGQLVAPDLLPEALLYVMVLP